MVFAGVGGNAISKLMGSKFTINTGKKASRSKLVLFCPLVGAVICSCFAK